MEKENANKHLTYEERQYIEIGLNQGRSFSKIAQDIKKDRRTVSREIQKHRFEKIPGKFNNSANKCKYKNECKKFDCTSEKKCYEEDICEITVGVPYVCNGCEKKAICRKTKYYYYSKIAESEYRETLSDSRKGIDITKSEIYEIDKLVSNLIKEKKQSLNHIYKTHKEEIGISKQTFYSYTNLGLFSFRNIDMPRKVRYKVRKTKEKREKREIAVRKGRTYEDYKKYVEIHPRAAIVEMDTVEGKKGGKVFLTLLLRKYNLMLVYILDKKNAKEVEQVFNQLKDILGEKKFKEIFEIILTDNGSEFLKPISIEKSTKTDEILTNVFYCDPNASWQKGRIEKNHEFIRYVLPKGKSFNELIQEDATMLANHINSTYRDSLNEKCPYELMEEDLGKEVTEKLNLKRIEPDEVNLSPNLLKRGDKNGDR